MSARNRIRLIEDLARAQAVRAKLVEIDRPLWKAEIAALLLKNGEIRDDSAIVEYLAERLNEHVSELRRNFQAVWAASRAGEE